jgi:hypothetical protein
MRYVKRGIRVIRAMTGVRPSCPSSGVCGSRDMFQSKQDYALAPAYQRAIGCGEPKLGKIFGFSSPGTV